MLLRNIVRIIKYEVFYSSFLNNVDFILRSGRIKLKTDQQTSCQYIFNRCLKKEVVGFGWYFDDFWELCLGDHKFDLCRICSFFYEFCVLVHNNTKSFTSLLKHNLSKGFFLRSMFGP